MRFAHDRRVTGLLEANNAKVEECRKLQADLAFVKACRLSERVTFVRHYYRLQRAMMEGAGLSSLQAMEKHLRETVLGEKVD